MRTVNMHEAKTHLSRLVEQAANGEPFVIARAGKKLVQVTRIDAEPAPVAQRLGMLKGQITVPDDFNTMFQAEIEEMFFGGDDRQP